ncbi:hypothetical protein VTO42DRAFT_5026 [Malbranchea cinnamomea]
MPLLGIDHFRDTDIGFGVWEVGFYDGTLFTIGNYVATIRRFYQSSFRLSDMVPALLQTSRSSVVNSVQIATNLHRFGLGLWLTA